MKLFIKKAIDEGKVSFTVTSDFAHPQYKKELNYLRDFTGHTNELGNPTMDKNFDSIFYGKHILQHPSGFPIFSDSDTAHDRAQKLLSRIKIIRTWVAKCKANDIAGSGSAEIEIPPSIEALQAEIETLKQKRDAKGRFIK